MATDVQVPAVESSTPAPAVETPAVAENNFDISSFTPEQHDNWRKTGEVPTKTPKEAPAPSTEDSEPSSEATDPAESAPASEAGREPQGKKRSDAPTRIKELLADKKRLESELATARAPRNDVKAEPSPVTPRLEAPKKPDAENWKGTWEELEAAKDDYFEKLADYKAKKAIEDHQAAQVRESENKRLTEQLTEGRKRYADFNEVINPVIQKLTTDARIAPEVGAILNASPVLVDLLYAIGSDEASLNDFIESARTDPAAAIRKAVLIEQLVITELKKKSPSVERDASGKFVPEKKTIPGAPPPPIEIGGKGTPPADEVESAAKSGDTRAYMDAANRRDLARHKG